MNLPDKHHKASTSSFVPVKYRVDDRVESRIGVSEPGENLEEVWGDAVLAVTIENSGYNNASALPKQSSIGE